MLTDGDRGLQLEQPVQAQVNVVGAGLGRAAGAGRGVVFGRAGEEQMAAGAERSCATAKKSCAQPHNFRKLRNNCCKMTETLQKIAKKVRKGS